MNTEKYYYGLDQETTKKDSSIIDCELPGTTPVNPSLNNTNSSILNKASTTNNYKKLDNCPQIFILENHNDAITDSSLYVIEGESWGESGLHKQYYYNLSNKYDYDSRDVYLGYEDINKIFTNKLSSIITTQVTTLDSDTAGCSAKAYLIQNDNTGAPIKFSLNKCTADRIITFSYKNTPIFKIQQTYKKELKIGDVLYSTSDGKLTLDKTTNGVTNTAIAICVIKEVTENFKNGDNSTGAVKTARFVSLNYMNYDSPSTGTKDQQSMVFGNFGTTIGNVKGGTSFVSDIGGKWNTRQCLSKTANQDPYIYAGVTNNSDTGYSPAVCCCVAYSTPGTKPGDWYLPSVGELCQIYANKTAINEKRTAIKGSGFSGGVYWSSREYSSSNEYSVNLNTGNIDYYSKNSRCYVLGFLALEV